MCLFVFVLERVLHYTCHLLNYMEPLPGLTPQVIFRAGFHKKHQLPGLEQKNMNCFEVSYDVSEGKVPLSRSGLECK